MLSLVALMVALSTAAAASGPGSSTPIFVGGKEGYDCFRIPALVALNTSMLLAFAEGRKFSCADHDWNDVVMKRSDDGGRTWAPLKVIVSSSTPSHHVTDGNPAPVALRNGSVVLPYCKNNKQVFVTRSDDGGASWTTPLELTNAVTGANWTWVATGPPGSLEMPNGDIVVAADHVSPDTDGSHTFKFSAATGQWTLGALLTRGNECQGALLANGSLILGMRPRDGNSRLFAVSNDAGASFGSVYGVSSLPDPHCEGSVVSPPSGDTLYLSNAASASSRTNMTVSTSRDQGATWQHWHHVYSGPSAYSALAITDASSSSRTLGLAFECGVNGPYELIAFAALTDPMAA